MRTTEQWLDYLRKNPGTYAAAGELRKEIISGEDTLRAISNLLVAYGQRVVELRDTKC